MAPGSIASSDTSSTSSASSAPTVGLSRSSGSEKPGPARSVARLPRRHPPVLRMVLEALQAGEQRRGTSVAAIKVYILQKYPTVDVLRLKYLLKQALATGMRRGLLVRPANSRARGATGSFKLVPNHKRKMRTRKAATMTAPRRPAQAKGKDPKKPSGAKKVPPNPGALRKGSRKPGEERTAPCKPGAAKEKAPRKDHQTKDQEARRDVEVHTKTKAGSQSSKPAATKGENGVASTDKKKMRNKVPKEAAAQGAGERPKAKAPAPPKGGGSKMEPARLSRKAEAPKIPRRPGVPTKTASSRAASKKAEGES
ncbi:histone H1.8 isoform X2 [Camelus bactrianus]|uniref:Histone H1.8 isoform X2 n=1 Tax=Camelus bactrianus TaxID=9837 RepID=A0AC58NRI3_CAMBA